MEIINEQDPLLWKIIPGSGPIVATAIHNGHQVRPDAADLMLISEEERLREEDPFTAKWTAIADSQVIGFISRFEVDLNRPREKAVYIKPQDAWGLHIWKEEPGEKIIAASLAAYDAFYQETYRLLHSLQQRFGKFVVLDLHSYNHRREGAENLAADPHANPEVNIGTGTMARSRWAPLVERFVSDLGSYDYRSRRLDVRENIKFRGGQFSRWIHKTFPESACSLAIEFKKFFMDEWTGIADQADVEEIGLALLSTLPGIREMLKELGARF